MDSTERVAELEARVAELTAQMERLIARTDQMSAPEERAEPVPASPASRRTMLKVAGAAAAGAVVAVGSRAMPAAANDPLDLTLGAAKATAGLTRADMNTGAPGGGLITAFFFQAGQAADQVNFDALAFSSALAGRTSTNNAPNGVFGSTNVPTGYGVVGDNSAAGGTGVRGRGVLVGVAGDATDLLGIGVTGAGTTGMRGVGTAIGAEGTSTTGVGVRGAGATGVLAVGVATGAQGSVTTADGVGVIGLGGDSGVGVRGVGGFYALEAAKSSKANLYLHPNNDVTGTPGPKTVPGARTDAHLAGEIDNVNGDLWLCVVAGTPGRWRKIGGVATAGAFHAVTPGRVYDSRVALPTPGALSMGGTRLLSVADRRDLVSGAVATANFVPAGATAISCNVTVVDTVLSGFLTINPGGTATINAATVNWSASGQILNNGVMLTLNATREITVIAGGIGGSSTHFVIDVNGYFL